MKKIFIAVVIAVVLVSLIATFGKKKATSGLEPVEFPVMEFEFQEYLANEKHPQKPFFTMETIERAEPNAVKAKTSRDPNEAASQIGKEIKEVKVPEKKLILGETIRTLQEICSSAVEMQKSLLLTELNKDANNTNTGVAEEVDQKGGS